MRRDGLAGMSGNGGAALAEAQAVMSAAKAGWLEDPASAVLIAALRRYGDGGELELPGDAGLVAVEAFLHHMLGALAGHPLGRVPLRHGQDTNIGSLLLGREGRALLSLIAREPGLIERRVAGFDGIERRELVLAGSGEARVARRRGEKLHFEPISLTPGTRIAIDGFYETLLVHRVDVRLVSLRIDRLPEAPVPVREYSLETGELLHQSSGDPRESELELAFALLGRMERSDAAPLLAEIARATEGAASDHLRWQALCECLALDTALGLHVLRALAGAREDDLHRPARDLLDKLYSAYPELAEREPA